MPNESKINRRVFESPEIRSIDAENRTVEFVASDNSVDSYGTVLPADKWDLSRYAKNGAVGYMHDLYGDSWSIKAEPDDIIGKGVAWMEEGKLLVRITFEPADLNERADKIFRKIQFGSLNAVSVGFMPNAAGHWGDRKAGEDPDVYYYNGQELLEVSVVNIPSNANAVRRSIECEREALPQKPQPKPEERNEDQTDHQKIVDESDDKSQLIIARANIARAMFNK